MIGTRGPRRARKAFSTRSPPSAHEGAEHDALRVRPRDLVGERLEALRLRVESLRAGDRQADPFGRPGDGVGSSASQSPRRGSNRRSRGRAASRAGPAPRPARSSVGDPGVVAFAGRVEDLRRVRARSRPGCVKRGCEFEGLTIANGPPGARLRIGIWTSRASRAVRADHRHELFRARVGIRVGGAPAELEAAALCCGLVTRRVADGVPTRPEAVPLDHRPDRVGHRARPGALGALEREVGRHQQVRPSAACEHLVAGEGGKRARVRRARHAHPRGSLACRERPAERRPPPSP